MKTSYSQKYKLEWMLCMFAGSENKSIQNKKILASIHRDCISIAYAGLCDHHYGDIHKTGCHCTEFHRLHESTPQGIVKGW